MRVKVAIVLEWLIKDGWYLESQRGSHRQFKNPTIPGRVTVPGKPNDDLHPKTYASIAEQAGWTK